MTERPRELWELRLCRSLGKTLAELRLLMLPGELEAHVADAHLHGPWWEARGDYHAAAVSRAVFCTAAADPPSFADCLIDWTPAPPSLLSWDEAAAYLLAGKDG